MYWPSVYQLQSTVVFSSYPGAAAPGIPIQPRNSERAPGWEGLHSNLDKKLLG